MVALCFYVGVVDAIVWLCWGSVAGGGGWFVCGGRVGCSFLTFQKDILDSRKSSETSERKQGNQGEGFSCGVGCQYLIHS